MRLVFALAGFHRIERGAEVALLSVADACARDGAEVTVIGGGQPRDGTAYRFVHVPVTPRERFERFPKLPFFRDETAWEDASFASRLRRAYDPRGFDAAITCAYPWTHFALRRAAGGHRPKQIFVTQNGDWPAFSDRAEFRFFDCDGLVCTNPDYEARNAQRWTTALIPNGIAIARYDRVAPDRARFGIPDAVPVVLMVSAHIETKRVLDGIRAVAQLPDAHLVVAGDGPLRAEADALAATLLPGRYQRLTTTADAMPALYASADTFLHMSLLESFGNVYVEAMASGLPIVANDTPRLRWIVGDDQPLCNAEDLPALGVALRAALAKGRGAPDPRARDFAWESIAARYRAFVARLTSPSATSSRK